MSTYNAFYSCLSLGGFIVTNHIRVITAIVFSACRSLFWFSYGCVFDRTANYVAVASWLRLFIM